MDPKNIDDFDPFSVPLISHLVEELNTAEKQTTDEGKENRKVKGIVLHTSAHGTRQNQVDNSDEILQAKEKFGKCYSEPYQLFFFICLVKLELHSRREINSWAHHPFDSWAHELTDVPIFQTILYTIVIPKSTYIQTTHRWTISGQKLIYENILKEKC